MKSMISQFYYGEPGPHAKWKPVLEQFEIDRDKAFHSYSSFLNKLPDDLKGEFVSLIDEHLALLPDELEQSFVDGFRLGARMIIEIHSLSDTET